MQDIVRANIFPKNLLNSHDVVVFIQVIGHQGHEQCLIEEEVTEFERKIRERRSEIEQTISDEYAYQQQLQTDQNDFVDNERAVQKDIQQYCRKVTSQRRHIERVS